MCVVSAIHDYGKQVNPDFWQIPGSIDIWQDLIKRGQEFDKVAEQPHCEDPEKTAFMRELTEAREASKDTTAKQRDDLAAKLQKAQAEIEELKAKLLDQEKYGKQVEAVKDAAYTERNQCVALIARMAVKLGHDVVVAPGNEPAWPIVYIQLPQGQVSWHFPAGESRFFEGLPFGHRVWDNHTTETKYARVNAAYNTAKPNLRRLNLGGLDIIPYGGGVAGQAVLGHALGLGPRDEA